jgi:hypothetical protein
MATYYKYKERGKEDRVDWSKITSEVSKRLRDITAGKEKYKKDIEDASAEYIKGLDNRPVGENENENARIAKFSEQAQNFELENLRKLKRGEIKSRDYLQGRNNLNSDTDLLFKISKEYQEVYAEKVKGQQGSTDANGNPIPPRASVIEAEAFAEAGRFANPNKASYDVDLITGTVRVSFLGDDGQPDLTKSQTLRQVQGMVLNKYNRYNGDANADAIAKGIGEDLRVVMKAGVKTRADAFGALMKDEEKSKALEDQIKASWGTTIGRASFLIDNVNSDANGNAYTVKFFDSEEDVAQWRDGTESKKGATAEEKLHTLVMLPDEDNPGRQKAVLTKDQEEYSMQKMKDRIKLRLDVKESARQEFAPRQPSAATIKSGEAKKKLAEGYKLAYELTSGGPIAAENISKIKSINTGPDGIANIYDDDEKYIIQYTDGRPDNVVYRAMRERRLEDGSIEKYEDRTESAVSLMAAINPSANYKVEDAEEARTLYFQGGGKEIPRAGDGYIGERIGQTADINTLTTTTQKQQLKNKSRKAVQTIDQQFDDFSKGGLDKDTPNHDKGLREIYKNVDVPAEVKNVLDKIKIDFTDKGWSDDTIDYQLPEDLFTKFNTLLEQDSRLNKLREDDALQINTKTRTISLPYDSTSHGAYLKDMFSAFLNLGYDNLNQQRNIRTRGATNQQTNQGGKGNNQRGADNQVTTRVDTSKYNN